MDIQCEQLQHLYLAACLAANVATVNISYGGDMLCLQAAGVELVLLVPQDEPNVPKFLRRKTGATILGFEFRMFSPTEPSQSAFSVPPECTDGRHFT